MPDYSEVKRLLAEQIVQILSLRNVSAKVVIGAVRASTTTTPTATVDPRISIDKESVKGLLCFENWSATFHLHPVGSTKPEHLRDQLRLALAGKTKKKAPKKKVPKHVKHPSVTAATENNGADIMTSAPGEPTAIPQTVPEESQTDAEVKPAESRAYSPVLLGKHQLPLLDLLTSFVLHAEDMYGSVDSAGVCKAIADTLSGAEVVVNPRSLSAVLQSLVAQGLLTKKSDDYYLTPFGQVVYITLSTGTCGPDDIDWGQVLGNPDLDLSDNEERDALYAVMAAEQSSYFTDQVSNLEAHVDQVEVKIRSLESELLNARAQLRTLRRGRVCAQHVLDHPERFARKSQSLEAWRRAIAGTLDKPVRK